MTSVVPLSVKYVSFKSKLTRGTAITYTVPKINELAKAFNRSLIVSSSSTLFFVSASINREINNPIFAMVISISLSRDKSFDAARIMSNILKVISPKATFLKGAGNKRRSCWLFAMIQCIDVKYLILFGKYTLHSDSSKLSNVFFASC